MYINGVFMPAFDYNSTILAVVNQKGGVGKTTVASVIAEYAATYGKGNVLIVDLDMQCNSSDFWVGMEASPQSVGGFLPPIHPDYEADDESTEERSSIADIFFGKMVMPHSTYINTDNDFPNSVDIMVGHPALLERINSEYDNASGKISSEIINRLGELLHLPDVAEAYELIILDTGPSRNPIFRAAIRAATHAIIPFEPEEKSLQGINSMLQVIESENFSRGDDNQLKLIGLCPNKVRANTKLHRNVLNSLHTNLPGLMLPEDVYLPHSTTFPERDVKGARPRSMLQISSSHPARVHSENVGRHIMGQLS
jgi:chromosome partitioning protein